MRDNLIHLEMDQSFRKKIYKGEVFDRGNVYLCMVIYHLFVYQCQYMN